MSPSLPRLALAIGIMVLGGAASYAIADAPPRIESIYEKMAQRVPISQSDLDTIARYAASGAPGMSHNDQIELSGALTAYGRHEEGRKLTDRIYQRVSAQENRIPDERLVFISDRHDPYVEESPKTVTDLRGLARRCGSDSVSYSQGSEEAIYGTRGAVLEYEKPRSLATSIVAIGAMEPYAADGECANQTHSTKGRCDPAAKFHYDRLAFPATDTVQNSRWNKVFIRHLVPTKTTTCEVQGGKQECTTTYEYTDLEKRQWGVLSCRID